MKTVKILKPVDYKRWDDFVMSHQYGTIYHTTGWLKVLEEAFSIKPIYLYQEDEDGHIRSGLPTCLVSSLFTGNRLVSLPLAAYCNPMVCNGEDIKQFISTISGFLEKEKCNYMLIKTGEDFTTPVPLERYPEQSYNSIIDLQRPLEDILNSFHVKCVKKAIKKSEESNLELKKVTDENGVREFYRIYVSLRKRLGLLPQPYIFFRSIWKNLSPVERVEILHSLHEGNVVGSIMFLKYKDTVICEYGGHNDEAKSLRPSHFIYWNGIKKAHEQGYRYFDFSRTSEDNPSLLQFKSRWDAKTFHLNYYVLSKIKEIKSYRESGLLRNLMSKTVQYSPESVCSVLGNILYRHFI